MGGIAADHGAGMSQVRRLLLRGGRRSRRSVRQNLPCEALEPRQLLALIDLGPDSFTPLAPVITFDEFPLGTQNPSQTFNAIPGLGNVTVRFAGTFEGQQAVGGSLNPHQPTGPLSLNLNGPAAFTAQDGSSDTSPVLSGTPRFDGPISVEFSVPVAAVGLKAGYFDRLQSTTIEAYAADGRSLGVIKNSRLGFEFYGLADSDGGNVIKGISIYITGNESAGFEIDNLTFGASGMVEGLAPSLSVEGRSRPYREGSELRPRVVRFTLSLSKPLTDPVEVDFWTEDGTARAGRDYLAVSGSVTFEAGDTERSVLVRLVGDWRRERSETFLLKATADHPDMPQVAERSAIIRDDDLHAGDLAYDAKGRLHQVYSTLGGLYHRVRSTDGEWSSRKRLEPKKGDYEYVSLTFSPSGTPAVAYYDAYRSLLKYAVQEDGKWTTDVVDGKGNAGQFCSLTFDARGNAAIGYFDKVNRNLMLAVQRSKTWDRFTLQEKGNVGWETELALHPLTRRLAVAFVNRSTGGVMYGEQGRRGWDFDVVQRLSRRNGDLSLAFDPATGQPALSYYDAKQKSLHLARFSGNHWTHETVANSGKPGSSNHLFFDDDGSPQVLYYSAVSKGIFLAERGGGSWQRRQLASNAGALFAAAGRVRAPEDLLWLEAPTEDLLVDLI